MIFVALTLLLSERFRAGWRQWWRDPERPRNLVDVMVKSAAIVGVFSAIQFFTVRPDVDQVARCFVDIDVERVVSLYAKAGDSVPHEVQLALDAWSERRLDDPVDPAEPDPDQNGRLCGIFDEDHGALDEDIATSGLTPSEIEQAGRFISRSAYQTSIFVVGNDGPGDVDDLDVVAPAGFHLVEGPGAPIDLPEGQAAAYRFRSDFGQINFIADVRANFERERVAPDIPLYAAALMGIWTIFGVIPAVIWCWSPPPEIEAPTDQTRPRSNDA